MARFTETPELECDAATLRDALEAAFARNPRLRGYVLDDQRSLLMGSTTGNLWASFDAGEHWAAVSGHLPPIHAVRFG